MAKFSRLLLGGVVGAGVALLFSRKDIRRRLMGGRAQLPAVTEPGPRAGMPTTAAAPMATAEPAAETTAEPAAAPMAGPTVAPSITPAAAPVDLESRIEETRRQVEERLENPLAPPVEVQEEIDVAEAPEVLIEEEAAETPAAEAEAISEEEVPAVGESGGEEFISEEVEEIVASEMITPDVDEEIAALKTPVEGEPTMEDEAVVQEEKTEAAGGPAPSQIDREEMRRRIDETRARLKAKAFDAIVSGETFVTPETEEAGFEKSPEGGVGLDREIEEEIDKSLKEED